jgi:putative tryptophan/tyrosine transport system substrate-binding protein
MRRREFIAGLGGAVAWPAVARGQQAVVPVIGFLNGQSPTGFAHLVAAFRSGLAEIGFVEDRNVKIEFRWAEGRLDKLPALAAELIQRPVDLIVAAGGAHIAAKAATSSIPIVFTSPGEPVKEGLVVSLNRPGGNATGVSAFSTNLEAKRFELLVELVPTASTIALLFDPNFWTANLSLPEVEIAASSLSKKLRVFSVNSESELDIALTNMNRTEFDALTFSSGPFFYNRRAKIIPMVARLAIPAMFDTREAVEIGGLISYGASVPDVYRRVGIYSGRILKGEKPADLPVLQPTKFELVINLKTAKALGLTVPSTLLARADEVIE